MPVLAPLQADPAAPTGTPRSSVRDELLVRVGLLVTAIAVLLDQATKRVAELTLPSDRVVPWLSDSVGWQLVYNDGGAWGFDAPSWFFLVVTVVVTVIVVRNLPRVTNVAQAIAYGMLMAGALGNALDRVLRTGDPGDPRFLHGHVIDFVAWGSFPRFNVADIAITCGFALLLISLYREERAQQQHEARSVPVSSR